MSLNSQPMSNNVKESLGTQQNVAIFLHKSLFLVTVGLHSPLA